MHRSGTSLIARLCHEGGGDLGDTATFHPADKWNPGGYYEQQAVLDVNIALINGIWGRLAYLSLPDTGTILRRAVKLAGKIGGIDRTYRGKIVKENRFCLSLPAWLEHGAAIESVLICLRHPHAVAKSLRRRNKIPLRLGYSLWREHYRRLHQCTGGIKTWYILYEELVHAERGPLELESSLRFLGMDIPGEKIRHIHAANVDLKMSAIYRPPVSLPDATNAQWEELLHRHHAQFDSESGSRAAVHKA